MAVFFNASDLSRCSSRFFGEQGFLALLGVGSICCNEDRKLGNVGESLLVVNMRLSAIE